MNYENVNGSRERLVVVKDLSSSGRRFICTSLSSSSEEEHLITLTASSLSLDSSDISSQDADGAEIEATASQMCLAEPSGLSSGTLTVSGYGSLSSSVSRCEVQYVEMSSSDPYSDMNCSFQEADISSSGHNSDENSFLDMHDTSFGEALFFDPFSNEMCNLIDQTSSSYGDADFFPEAEQIYSNSDAVCNLIDQTSSSSENVEVFPEGKRNVQFCNDVESTSSSEKDSCPEQYSVKYEKFVYESNLSSSCFKVQDCWLSSESELLIKTKTSNITIENISKISQENIKREDITNTWVLRDYYDRCISASFCSESSESFKTAESDLEDLGFRDTFAFASTKLKEFEKSSKQILFDAKKDDDIIPVRQTKVTFAPPESLVTVRNFERSAEELEDDNFFRAIVADAFRFQMRISAFKEMMDPFLTQEFRSIVRIRNGFFSMDE